MKLHIKKGILAGVSILVFSLGSCSFIEGLTYACMNDAFRPNNPAPFVNIPSLEALLDKAREANDSYVKSIPPELITMLLLGIGLLILWLCLHAFQKEADVGMGRFLSRELFLRILDLEVKRARRYQGSFCVVKLKLSPLTAQEHGKRLQKNYQSFSKWLRGELREIDVIGSLGDNQLAVLLPYADLSGSGHVRSRLEGRLKYFDFKKYGYQVMIEQICFPQDGTATEDLVHKVIGTEAS